MSASTSRTGEVMGVVGESGAGKSLSGARYGFVGAALKIAGGSITLAGRASTMTYEQCGASAAKEIGAIFQDPLTRLQPPFTRSDDSSLKRSAPISIWGLTKARGRARSLMLEVGICGADGASTITRTSVRRDA